MPKKPLCFVFPGKRVHMFFLFFSWILFSNPSFTGAVVVRGLCWLDDTSRRTAILIRRGLVRLIDWRGESPVALELVFDLRDVSVSSSSLTSGIANRNVYLARTVPLTILLIFMRGKHRRRYGILRLRTTSIFRVLGAEWN
jgi:hypothetical protein